MAPFSSLCSSPKEWPHKQPTKVPGISYFIMARIGRDLACNIYIMTPERYSDYVWPSHLVRKNM